MVTVHLLSPPGIPALCATRHRLGLGRGGRRAVCKHGLHVRRVERQPDSLVVCAIQRVRVQPIAVAAVLWRQPHGNAIFGIVGQNRPASRSVWPVVAPWRHGRKRRGRFVGDLPAACV